MKSAVGPGLAVICTFSVFFRVADVKSRQRRSSSRPFSFQIHSAVPSEVIDRRCSGFLCERISQALVQLEAIDAVGLMYSLKGSSGR